MAEKMKALLIGDAMIPGIEFRKAAEDLLSGYLKESLVDDWEPNWDRLQHRRLEVEKQGPGIEEVPALVERAGSDAEILMGLFVPISASVYEKMPRLKIAGVCRAGTENVDIEEATRRGILVFNIEGRNAEAVSDFAVGMILSECRNIARAHLAIRSGSWRKEFSNSEWVPQLKGKTIGIVGFGYIGQLVARKLSGFDVRCLVHDPFADEQRIRTSGCEPADRDTLVRESDFITLHARLSEENRHMIGERELSMMKPNAYLINTARAGLVDEAALAAALTDRRIAGAALDVFSTEPISKDSPFLALDNVTLTSHLAGTTREALSSSPYLLMEDILKLFRNEEPRFIRNPEVLRNTDFSRWLEGVRGR